MICAIEFEVIRIDDKKQSGGIVYILIEVLEFITMREKNEVDDAPKQLFGPGLYPTVLLQTR